ncbi:TPA: hypothetical protein ACGJUX_000552 [Escherichia coli]|uniref:hypothetical protein n=1 Tax=Escherichia coli TaxID=562 RepID=UPI0011E9ABF3|nr:hypothetical protein [Escherichia coli]HAG7093012.1 hypothetical protein [Escherichia coli]HAW7870576.1 hypothetical protein [Escherichia coli]HAW8308975.1 hypothetical protein [Escherichia coli]
MMYHILMEIKAVRYIRDIVLDSENDYTDIMVHYRCKTPLSESDTCAMICRYFESVYFDDEAGGDYFIPKTTAVELWSEMGGVLRCKPDHRSLSLKVDNTVIIPVIPEIVYALQNGTYDSDSSDITSSVNTWFGDLFDDNGDLIIHKQNC